MPSALSLAGAELHGCRLYCLPLEVATSSNTSPRCTGAHALCTHADSEFSHRWLH